MPRLILHIGSGKAGSTTLQSWLRRNNKELQEVRCHFLDTPGEINQTRLPAYAAEPKRNLRIRKRLGIRGGELKDFREEFRRNFLEELQIKRDAIEVFFASSENLFLDLVSKREIRRLKGLLDEVFDDIQVVLFLRRQDRFAVSQFNDAIKRYFEKGMDPFCYIADTKFDEFLSYHRKATMWESVFGRKNMKVFGEVDALESFRKIANIPESSRYEDIPRQNTALQPEAMELIRRLNLLVEDGRIDRPFVSKIHGRLAKSFGGRGVMPARSDAEAFFAKYRSSNRKLAKQAGIELDALFSSDFSMYPEESDFAWLRRDGIDGFLSLEGVKPAVGQDLLAMVADRKFA